MDDSQILDWLERNATKLVSQGYQRPFLVVWVRKDQTVMMTAGCDLRDAVRGAVVGNGSTMG